MKNKLLWVVIVCVTFFFSTENVFAIKNIIVSEGSLVPYFNENVYKYNLFLSEEVTSINIDVIKDDSDDYTSGVGQINLNLGLNVINLEVFKKEYKMKKYTVNIYRGYSEEKDYVSATLKNLEIVGFDILFSPNIFEYTINVAEDTKYLDIKYEALSEFATVKLSGDIDLNEIENIILLEVISKDGENSSIYSITAKKVKTVFENTDDNKIVNKNAFTKKDQIISIASISSIALLLILIIYKLIFKKRRLA